MQSFKGIQSTEQQKVPKILLGPSIGGRHQFQCPDVEFIDQSNVVKYFYGMEQWNILDDVYF